MAFVNEYIPREDFAKYEIDAANRRYVLPTTGSEWTIDRSRNIFVRILGRGREEFAHESTWTLYFEGQLIEFGLDNIDREKLPDGTVHAFKRLRFLNLPDDLIERREEILALIREALTAYKDGGVFALADKFRLTLDV